MQHSVQVTAGDGNGELRQLVTEESVRTVTPTGQKNFSLLLLWVFVACTEKYKLQSNRR